MTRIPVQTDPPTLLPNFDKPVVNGAESPAEFLAANPRVDATAVATILGSATTGNKVTLAVTNPIFGEIGETYTVQGGDTIDDIADALAALFNEDARAQDVDLRVDVLGPALTFRQGGPVGNFSTIVVAPVAPAKLSIGGVALTGDVIAMLFNSPSFTPIKPAIAEATIGGVIVPTDTVALTFTNSSVASLPVTKTYTVQAGDTASSVAAGLAALINGDATLGAAGIQAQQEGTGLTFFHQGAVGNSTVVSRTVSGTETVVFSPSSGDMSGGAGQPGGVLVTYPTTTSQTPAQMATALALAITDDAELAAQSISATASGGVITLTVPAAAEPLTFQSWVNTIAPVATIGGTPVDAGDVVNLIFNAAYLPGGTHTVSHTVLLGETTSTIATNLANAINADAIMIEAGITATPSTNDVDISYQAAAGQIRFDKSISPGSETVTWTATPTETIGATTFTLTIGGTATGSDTVNVQFSGGALGSPETAQATVTGGWTTTQIAAAVATAINNDATLATAGITASSATNVVSVSESPLSGTLAALAWANGPAETATVGAMTASNAVTIGNAAQSTDTVALTFTNGAVSGLPVTKTYTVQVADTLALIAAGLAALINGDATLQAAYISATHTTGSPTLTILQPQAIGNSTVLTYAVGGSTPTETVTFNPMSGHLTGGVGAPGNIFTLTVTGKLIAGSPITLSHTVAAGEGEAAIATALAALINGSTPLTNAGFAATPTAAVVSITWPASAGPATFSRTITGPETLTLAGGPTETITVASGGTESIELTPSDGELSGGSGPIIAAANFTFAFNGQAQAFFFGQPYPLSFDYVTALVNQGQPIV